MQTAKRDFELTYRAVPRGSLLAGRQMVTPTTTEAKFFIGKKGTVHDIIKEICCLIEHRTEPLLKCRYYLNVLTPPLEDNNYASIGTHTKRPVARPRENSVTMPQPEM